MSLAKILPARKVPLIVASPVFKELLVKLPLKDAFPLLSIVATAEPVAYLESRIVNLESERSMAILLSVDSGEMRLVCRLSTEAMGDVMPLLLITLFTIAAI